MDPVESEARMPEVVRELREITDKPVQVPSLEAVRTIVDYLSGKDGFLVEGPDELAARVGLPVEGVYEIVSGLGTFLGQSSKISAGRAEPVGRAGHPTAAEVAERLNVVVSTPNPQGQLVLFPIQSASGTPVLPLGWDRASTGREMNRAVANIVVRRPDDETLRRWLRRHFEVRVVPVSAGLVTTLWMLARLGRVHEVGALAEKGGAPLARALADSWELLAVARADAVDAMIRLCSAGGDLEQVRADLARARWLGGADLLLVDAAAEAADSEDAESMARLEDAIASLAVEATRNRDRLMPELVSQLDNTQVERLCEAFGLFVENPVDLRRKVNGLIEAAGLAADSDQLVSLGLAALRAGLDNVFSDALQRHRDGDPCWAVELSESLGAR